MSFEDEMRSARANFIVEAGELIVQLEESLLALELNPDLETVNSLFRAAHTIKGSAGLFGLETIVTFTHVVENVLVQVRDQELAVSPELIGCLLEAKDAIAVLIDAAASGEEVEPDPVLMARLSGFLLGAGDGRTVAAEGPGQVADEAGLRLVRLTIRFGPDTLRSGMDPLSFIRYLAAMGDVEEVTTLTAGMPDVADLDPERCYLGFLVALRTSAPLPALHDVFEFVREDSEIGIVEEAPPGPDAPAVEVTAAGLPAVPVRSSDTSSIRVDAARLDRLIDAVGELLIAGAGAAMHGAVSKDEALIASLGEVTRLVEEVRASALQLRMVPIGTTFARFQRIVRDVASALQKDVGLVITGGETEVDKALVEQIGDPLMHLVRNALDHGIEAPSARAADGKPARATLHLNAFHDSGSIVIEVRDDGAGIDTGRVLAKARERGLVGPDVVPSDRDIHSLIFEPGFSTAAQVSDLSGRGVGMDVVKRNVAAMRGTIDVRSEPGRGTTIVLRLPLTLAIIDGFLVDVDDTVFVIPLDHVVECVQLPAAASGRGFMDLRGDLLPLLRLRALFGTAGDPPRRENVVVVEHAGQRIGLVVDSLRGEFQTVIKPLAEVFRDLRGIGGSTILGNGEVALIIDVPVLTQHADRGLALVS